MSLINDALKQAREAQEKAPESQPELVFRTLDEPLAGGGPGRKGALAATVLVGGILALAIWRVALQSSPTTDDSPENGQATVRARSVEVPAPEPPAPAPAPPAPTPSPAPDPPPVAAPAPAQPPLELTLKGIVLHPTRASAFINGRVLFVGDRILNLTVSDIQPGQVTLTNGTTVRVMELDE